jgi:hypothetical protein
VSFDQRLDRLETRINAGIQAGVIDRREARELRNDVRMLRRTEAAYSRNGITQQEHEELQGSLRELRNEIRDADGGYRYRDRYASDDDFFRDYYGTGGPYEEQWVIDTDAQARTGVSGIFDTFLGNGMRVGQRAGTNLYAVPTEFRDQFRDSSRSYYRTDGTRIYEIDPRTRTITQVYVRAPD